MEPEQIEEWVDAVMAKVTPGLRAAAWTWEQLDIVAPTPEELVETLIAHAFPGEEKSTD